MAVPVIFLPIDVAIMCPSCAQFLYRSSAFANYMDKDALEEEAVLEAMWQASEDEA